MRCWVAPLFLLTVLAAGAGAAEPRVVGYLAGWSVTGRKYDVGDIPADRLTHINYAFAKIEKGECALVDAFAATERTYPGDKPDKGELRGLFNQLIKLKAKHPHLRTLVSVGGWTLSGPFSDAALTEESRAKFAKSAASFVTRYGFDGIDIDWEYPGGGGLEKNKARPADRENFTLLLSALRKELDAAAKADKKHYLLTIAAPAGPKQYANIELAKVAKLIDWFNLMTYDFAGSWSPVTNFNAPLYPAKDRAAGKSSNVDAAVTGYLDAGVPADKVVVGVPFYGRAWGGVKDENGALFQPHSAASPRGSWEYRDLAASYIGKVERHWHDEAKVPWLFDAKKGLMISYDDPESLRLKAEYVKKKKLGGVMIWELSADDKESSLLKALQCGLGTKK
jgi:chitinase